MAILLATAAMSVIISVSCWLLLQRYEKRHNHHTCGGLIFTREACNTPCSQRHGICRCHRPYIPPPQTIYPTEPAYICPQSLRESPCARRFIASILPPRAPKKHPGLTITRPGSEHSKHPGLSNARPGYKSQERWAYARYRPTWHAQHRRKYPELPYRPHCRYFFGYSIW